MVTGAARGLGAALAERLAARGARLALVGLEPERLRELAGALGPEASDWRANVTDADALAEVAAAVRDRYGRVDIVVSNAGIAAGGFVRSSDPDTYDRVIEVNLMGSIRTARAFLPALLDSRGYLLQVASVAALAPTPGMSAYGTSKAGVEAFAHALGAEVAGRGVDVGVAYLSWTDTDMVRSGPAPVSRPAGPGGPGGPGGPAGPGGGGATGGSLGKLPGPLGRVYPLGPAADRIVAGIERRAPHIYAQPWLRAAVALRAATPSLLLAGARRAGAEINAAEDAMVASGPAWRHPVGPGGAADSADVGRMATGEAERS